MHHVIQLHFLLSIFLLNLVPFSFSSLNLVTQCYSHVLFLLCRNTDYAAFYHQCTLNTEVLALQKKVKNINSINKPFSINLPLKCVCSCLYRCPRAWDLSWPWRWQPGVFHRSMPVPRNCLLPRCWWPTPRWHKPTTAQDKTRCKTSLGT